MSLRHDSLFIPRLVPGLVLLATLSSLQAEAAEIFVDGKAAGGGTGMSKAPFKTINDAVKNAAAGTTITIKSGVYESMRL